MKQQRLHRVSKPVISNLLDAINEVFHGDFSAADVHMEMARRQIHMTRTHVSTVLARLVERKQIYVAFEGSGSVPHIYRKVRAGTASAVSEEAHKKVDLPGFEDLA